MHPAFIRLQARSRATYICLFGAVFGAAVFGTASPPGILFLWLVMGSIGVILAIIKDNGIPDARMRSRVFLADGLSTTALLLVYGAMPAALGLVRGLCILIVAAVYVTLYYRWLDSGRIIPKEA